ncbi:DUF4124 domain-containing protein [Marinicella litoralis]|uniref:Uncharacterized protein DUF4124 n=1 Tax=Marinicella litoralis TaxID=644220 RepID=A0A4R6XFZ1_9GAMM|nr:DUF4124 domain-containing protein [Marinicella litoralis]TDR18306.1 uncharacterized protein DUF4124 [Marinicella litoralis]
MKNTVIISVLLLLACAFTAEAKLYKWVDEDGKVHYSDKMPPDQIKNAHQELNKDGIVKDKVERALTPEERKIKEAELKKEREILENIRLEAERIEKERNALIKSYSSADQITRLKSERVIALKRNIQMAEENLVIQNRNLEDLLKRAADKERSGEVVSDTFLKQIDQIKAQIENQKGFIQDKTEEIATTEEKYDSELEKYLMYTQGSKKGIE